jgi:hypothetical protein
MPRSSGEYPKDRSNVTLRSRWADPRRLFVALDRTEFGERPMIKRPRAGRLALRHQAATGGQPDGFFCERGAVGPFFFGAGAMRGMSSNIDAIGTPNIWQISKSRASAHAVFAALIFLNLLKAEAQLLSEMNLAHFYRLQSAANLRDVYRPSLGFWET